MNSLSFLLAAASRAVRACLRPGSVNPAATPPASAEQETKNPTVAAGITSPGREEEGAIRRPLTAAALAERAAAAGRRATRQEDRAVFRKAHESLGETVRFPSA